MKDNIATAAILEPYAKALMSLAQSQNLVERFGEDVSFLINLLNSSNELKQFLANPLIGEDAKKGVLRQLVGEQSDNYAVHPFMLNFLLLLVERRRVLFLGGICRQYQALLRQFKQIVLAEVISAVELNDQQKETVRQKVLSLVNAAQVELETTVDPDLIGGVIIKVGSQVIDASLRGQVRRIGLRLASTT